MIAFPKQNTWNLVTFNLCSVLMRQISEKVAYKHGFDYLLECFLPSTFAQIISILSKKCPLPLLTCIPMIKGIN